MQLWQTIATGVAIVIVLTAVGWWLYQRNRTRHLRERFGPEYDRRIADRGNRRMAESELTESENRARKLRVQALSSSDRMKFIEEWRLCQARFVDDPSGAVDDADDLVTTIMRTRGYAVDDPYDRVADVSAAYPNQANSYRRANDIIVRHHRGNASTEDLRRAFMDFRALFDEMLAGPEEQELRRAS
jgi:hypothetical protein